MSHPVQIIVSFVRCKPTCIKKNTSIKNHHPANNCLTLLCLFVLQVPPAVREFSSSIQDNLQNEAFLGRVHHPTGISGSCQSVPCRVRALRNSARGWAALWPESIKIKDRFSGSKRRKGKHTRIIQSLYPPPLVFPFIC